METSVNNKCKAFTSLEQSKKLAEILSIESADMWYCNSDPNKITVGKWEDDEHDEDDIPCWSLAALLELIPNYVINKVDDKIYANLYYGLKSSHDNLVDAAFEMICQLKENNKI